MSLTLTEIGVLAETPVVRVSVEPALARLSLRARDAAPFADALGFALPDAIAARAGDDALEAAKLGPDEWVLTGRADRIAEVARACAALYDAHPHSLVEISGREVALSIEGPAAADLLAFGCPRDIDAIPAGTARRTLFDGATVVLWRDAPLRFRMDVWRSFAPHVAHLMALSAKELAAEAA